jgi:hypothetical protein
MDESRQSGSSCADTFSAVVDCGVPSGVNASKFLVRDLGMTFPFLLGAAPQRFHLEGHRIGPLPFSRKLNDFETCNQVH